MRTTVVPAQITSVEDRIAANLSFKQLLLLIAPVFIGAGLFTFLPPFASFRFYKLAIALAFAAVCIVLAVRVKGRLIIEWIGVLSRYNLRPRIYVFNKNDKHLRHIPKEEPVEPVVVEKKTKFIPEPRHSFEVAKVLHFERVVSDPQADFYFSAKKGGLRVHIKEIK